MKSKPQWWQENKEAYRAGKQQKRDAAGQLEAVQAEAKARALTLRAARISKKRAKVPAMHWMFDDAETGSRVLNYWPGAGTYLSPGGLRGQSSDPWEVLELATRLYLQLPADPDETPFP